MEVNLSPELQAKLARIAAENNSGAEEYARQLIDITLTMMRGSAKTLRGGWASLTSASLSPTKKLVPASTRCSARRRQGPHARRG
jgi:hypothetical protein